MSDYGRGPGSEPWHPDDPLYGDQGWGDGYGTQDGHAPRHGDAGGQGQWPSGHGDHQQHPHQQHPHQQHPHQQHPPQGHQHGQSGYPQDQQYQQQSPGYPHHQQYQQSAHPYPEQHPQQHQDPYQGYHPQQHHDPYQQQQASGYPYPQQGGWEGGQHYDAEPYDPYGREQPDAYGAGAQRNTAPQQAEPMPPQDAGRRPAPGPGARRRPEEPSGPDPDTGWDPGPDQGESDFFSGRDNDDDVDDRDEPGGRRGGRSKKKGKPQRSGFACLVAALVLTGGLGTATYLGYQFYDSRFGGGGPPEDYAGEGTGEVQVEIPEGASLSKMGNILKEAGVVKSHDAFVAAAAADEERSRRIQAGVYTLRKEMSAVAAIEMLVSPEALNTLTIPEGWRTTRVYQAIDERLDLAEGTTEEIAESGDFDLPDWATGNPEIKSPLEGFLFPARYNVGEGVTPEDLLSQMVDRAVKEYERFDLAAAAQSLGLESPMDVLTVASLVQAEGKTHEDFRKMARVVYNRLEPTNDETNGKIEFDSTYNYIMNQSEILLNPDTLRSHDDPYNTYYYRGLPPGPIGNPGSEAVEAAIDPEPGEWMYFVSVDGNTTEFAVTYEDHQRLVEKFNEFQRQQNDG
ncbi:endolytic transglycosylase MltG [Streptomyces sodiiphilus]|uniref:Endolytic murein transglycosylase n=1 Tax=Streptomyces sodiiphilus TaxID=226217 RepID=A0ABN2NRG8_9ACTN